MQRLLPALMGLCGGQTGITGENAAEHQQGWDDTCQEGNATDGFRDRSRGTEIPQFLWDKARTGGVMCSRGCWADGLSHFVLIVAVLDGCFCTWAGLIKPHGTKYLVCSRLSCEKVWSFDLAWAAGTQVALASAEPRRKPLNLSLRYQRADGAITIPGHHHSHRKPFLLFPELSMQSQLDWLITSFFSGH